MNDKYAEVSHIRSFIMDERESLAERDKPRMKVSIKADKDTKMGIITDVKMELRQAWALSIVYSATQR